MKELLKPVIKEDVLRLAKEGKRIDGRKKDEFRKIKIEPGLIEKSNGSAMVTLGNSQVLAGVTLLMGVPYPDTPDAGALAVTSELVPLADPKFESGPPREPAIELARVVDRGIRESKMIDMSKMVVEKGKHVWMTYVDLWVLDSDGSLIDVAGIAALAAIVNAKKQGAKMKGDEVVLDEKFKPLPTQEQPVPCTTIKIGDVLLTDATREEENAMDGRITATTRKDGSLCAMQKGEAGVFTEDEIAQAIDNSIARGKEIRKLL